MTDRLTQMIQALAEIRASFDESFAVEPLLTSTATIDLLLLRDGQQRFALRLEDLSSVQAMKTVVPLPGGPSELLGMTGYQGRVLPVFSLAAILGHRRPDRCRWLCLCGQESIGLAVGEFERLSRVPLSVIQPTAGAADSGHVTHGLDDGEAVIPILDLRTVIARIASSSVTDQKEVTS